MSTSDINKLREISRICCDDIKTHKYVKSVCFKILRILTSYAKYKKVNIKSVLRKYLGGEFDTSNFTRGQVYSKDILQVFKNGNIREYMSIILNFASRGSNIIIWALNKQFYSLKANRELSKRMYLFTGSKKKLYMKSYITPREGSVTLSRNDNMNPLRKRRKHYIARYTIKSQQFYPPISSREYRFLKNKKSAIISGLQYWEINNKNYYVKLMKKHNQMVICGPSKTTDAYMSVFKLFANFNIKKAISACVAVLCYAPDHSPCEILLAAIPYGLNDWVIEMDSFKYIKTKIKN
jgi:hypothetical protein